MENKELIIDETNFDQYFFDARKHGPKEGHVLACYEAVAEFVDGDLKRDIVNLLMSYDNAAESAQRVFQKLGGASYRDSIRVVKEIVDDLVNGVTVEEVLEKPYEYHLQLFYYTLEEYIPKNDKHWSKIKLINLIDKDGNKLKDNEIDEIFKRYEKGIDYDDE